jgi:membrane fusion protein, multidrug efflux system
MKNTHLTAIALAAAALLAACSPKPPSVDALRPVRTAEVRYDAARDASRYAATVQSRYEVDQAFRVGGKVVQRKVDVGQVVREGDVLAVLDDSDYRLAEDAARQQWQAAVTLARQAESDRQRLADLKRDGSVSAADDERTTSGASTARANAEALARQLELARNRLQYTVLRAPRGGVVTAVRFEVGQVVPEGLPVVAIADPGASEIVVDVPEDQLASFRKARFSAALAQAPDERFDVVLRELSPQAAAQTRTYRARLEPVHKRPLPLGATASLTVDLVRSQSPVAMLPASALTQSAGAPAVWVVRSNEKASFGTVELLPVQLHGYRNDDALVSGPPAGAQVVTAGVQKMAPGMKVAVVAAVGGAALADAHNARQAAK